MWNLWKQLFGSRDPAVPEFKPIDAVKREWAKQQSGINPISEREQLKQMAHFSPGGWKQPINPAARPDADVEYKPSGPPPADDNGGPEVEE